MPMLDLDPSEVSFLSMLVRWRLSGLAMELDHTDSREFKEVLRRQRDQLEKLQEKLTAQGG